MNEEALYVKCAQIMILSDICIQKYSRYLVVDLLYRLQSKHSLTIVMLLGALVTIIFLVGGAKADVPRLTSSVGLSAGHENRRRDRVLCLSLLIAVTRSLTLGPVTLKLECLYLNELAISLALLGAAH